jgi:hypothetical protein
MKNKRYQATLDVVFWGKSSNRSRKRVKLNAFALRVPTFFLFK